MTIVLMLARGCFAIMCLLGVARIASPVTSDFCDMDVFTMPNGSLSFKCNTDGVCFFDCGDLRDGICKLKSFTVPAGPGGDPPAKTYYSCACENGSDFSEAPCLTMVKITLSVPPVTEVSCHNTCCADGGCSVPFPAGPYNGDPCPCP